MNENQKLREVLQHAIEDLSSATGFLTGRSRERQSKTVAALAQLQADIALPTADHIPDAGRMVVDHFPDATKMIETAAPVGEREAFEREMSKPPFEFCMDRWPDDGSSYAWPGNYVAYHTQCAWAVWQARAALSAGDAVDAKRYRWLRDNGVLGFSGAPSWRVSVSFDAMDAYAQTLDSNIDAAMLAAK